MDIALVETLNGGDFVRKGEDFFTVNGWENMPYLAMFGGNFGELTPRERIAGELNKDFWGNDLMFRATPKQQFNSRTENALVSESLTSAGMRNIQRAIEDDLKFMKDFADVTVLISLDGNDRIKANINIRQITNLSGRVADEYTALSFVFDRTKAELGDFNIFDFNNDFNV